ARGTSRAGRHSSPARDVTASQPTNPHTRTPTATATLPQPYGANGCRFAGSACGSAVTVAVTSIAISRPERTSCTLPDIRTPQKLATATMRLRAAAVPIVVAAPPPKAAATYAPANIPAAGAPTGAAK